MQRGVPRRADATELVSLATIEEAARALEGSIRRTPTIRVGPTRAPLRADARERSGVELLLKLENLQLAGSFKVRGALNHARGLAPAELQRGLITASGGNHGLGVAAVGRVANVPATIYVPRSTDAAKIAKLRRWGARVEVHGEVWDDANATALQDAARLGLTYIHPFAPPRVIAGQGTIALEILEDAPEVETLVIAIGGGGLIAGVATAAKALRPELRVIGVEPTGAATLTRSLEAGALVELAAIETRAGTLAPRRSEALNLELIRRHVDDIALVSDAQMTAAARWLWDELGVAAELSAAAGVAALMAGAIATRPGERVCALICGAGTAGLD